MTIHNDRPVSRRELLRATTCTAAAAGIGAIMSQAMGAAQSQPGASKPLLPHGTLGRTKFPVTLVSFGAIKLRDKAHTKVLKLAIDKGVNLVHTSDSYGRGKSIEAVADLFKADKRYRDKVFMCLKGLEHQKEPDLDQMLKTLGTDHVDAWLCELQKPDAKRLETVQALLDETKKKGKVRHAGFVCHVDMNGSIEMVVEKAPSFFDVALLATTMAPIPGDKSKDRVGEQSERFVKNLKALRDCGVGILSMKSGAGEAVQKGADVYLPHAKAILQAGADSVLTSMDAFDQVEMIAKLDLKSPHMTADDRKAELDFRKGRANTCLIVRGMHRRVSAGLAGQRPDAVPDVLDALRPARPGPARICRTGSGRAPRGDELRSLRGMQRRVSGRAGLGLDDPRDRGHAGVTAGRILLIRIPPLPSEDPTGSFAGHAFACSPVHGERGNDPSHRRSSWSRNHPARISAGWPGNGPSAWTPGRGCVS